ncbi:hypothetical protein [Nonomuraea endophytica]|uniref:hypothetical protein n=1 Tax=Nonomuraea endophytica TaxID=714136 RepID=UPI0037C91278
MSDSNSSLVIADTPITVPAYRVPARKRVELYTAALRWASRLTRQPHGPALVIAHSAVIFSWLAEATSDYDLNLRHAACAQQSTNQLESPPDNDPEGFCRRAAELYNAIRAAA